MGKKTVPYSALEGIQWMEGQGQEGVECSTVSVDIHPLELWVLTRTSPNFANTDTFRYKHHIIITV